MNGKVIAQFTLGGTTYKVGRQISSLRVLLEVEQELIADSALQADIDQLVSGLPRLEPDCAHGFDVIYCWRNRSLHGAQRVQVVGATVFGLTLRVLVSELVGSYEDLRIAIKSSLEWRASLEAPRTPWQYYPPTQYGLCP
jgi:hypothetical protein